MSQIDAVKDALNMLKASLPDSADQSFVAAVSEVLSNYFDPDPSSTEALIGFASNVRARQAAAGLFLIDSSSSRVA